MPNPLDDFPTEVPDKHAIRAAEGVGAQASASPFRQALAEWPYCYGRAHTVVPASPTLRETKNETPDLPPPSSSETPVEADEGLALMKSLAQPCTSFDIDGDHYWRSCRSCLAAAEIEHNAKAKGYLRAAIAAVESQSRELASVRAEKKALDVAREKCDHCGRTVPRDIIALEIRDGAPVANKDGHAENWCIACHAQGVLERMKAKLEAAESSLQEMTREQKKHMSTMEDFLAQVHEFLDDQADVVDGDYGQPRPNRAMALGTELVEVARKLGITIPGV